MSLPIGQNGTGVPARAGIALKVPHHDEVVRRRPPVAFFEVHTENYMAAGGLSHHYLSRVAEHYPLSFHGVGLSLGSAEPLDRRHLDRIRGLVDRYRPALVSEHLAWCIAGGVFHNDLLPVPYTAQALDVVVDHIKQTQDVLGRRILVENPSTYLRFVDSEMAEVAFLTAMAERSGCGLLLDVNNIHVSARNHGFDARAYVDAVPPELVGEIHLAGHALREHRGRVICIDDHGSPVSDAVWQLYDVTIQRLGPRPTLIEWDNDIPELDVLLDEAAHADRYLAECDSAQPAVADHG